jgi:hypothetical protein
MGTTTGFCVYDCVGFSPMALPPNAMMVLTVTYEYLFCLPLSERL